MSSFRGCIQGLGFLSVKVRHGRKWSLQVKPLQRGLDAYAGTDGGDHAVDHTRRLLADRLVRLLMDGKSKNWVWFENVLSYDNARLPQALIQTGLTTRTPEYVSAGLRSLEWRVGIQTGPSVCFRPVGSQSFGKRYDLPAAFDQQPVERQRPFRRASLQRV